MYKLSPEEAEARKKSVFDAMGPRRQKFIINKVGYDKWDPFQEPKDPIDIRKDKSNRTTQMLVRDFLHSKDIKDYSNAYGSGVLEICLGLINNEDRYLAMYEFSCWYQELLKRENIEK
ncbi:Uncharacterized protein dnl_03430 [Desulfonema limicola]|uniref:Uncharacterized protein n=1 Tax=Desulfonema limicola TaxID=45656 RepID=A0A975B3J3_9BACT|nr:hypothetical protein [Desulfonema limicola]QTA78129.1 Uncharacterized protein dnl_03430 [Desulfonema limicola]